ncbi:DoxX family protein [Nonomuraea sp. NPDC049152]|uniref:DoxX family protein n=1 Tax=Nonomuraea sp. NPDC049152 TaxID=3154350 RepID=UPI00340D24E3
MATEAARPRHWDGGVNGDSASSTAAVRDTWVGAGLLVLRVALGATFLLHGVQNLFGTWTGWDTAKMAGYLGSKGVGASHAFSWITAITEMIAGVLLLAGLLTSVGAAIVVVTMAVSSYIKLSAGGGFFMPKGFEWELAVLAGGLGLLLAGAGRFALDGKLSARALGRARTISIVLAVLAFVAIIPFIS